MERNTNATLFTDIVLEIFKLNGLLNSQGDRLAKEFGLSSARWKVLGAIYMQGSAQTVSQIAHNMGQSRQAIQKVVTAMKRDGFIVLKDNPKHKKAKLIALTSKGVEAYQALDKKQIIWSNACAETLDIEKLEVTIQLLKKIANDFECNFDEHL